MKKTNIYNMQKFASAAVYFCVLSIFLALLTGWYGESVLTKNIDSSNVFLRILTVLTCSRDLSNPLVFAIAVLLMGLFASFVYWAFNWLLKLIMTFILKEKTNALNSLSEEECTMIGIVSCLLIGIVCLNSSKENPKLAVMHQMLFSLPIAKVAFITSSLKEIIDEIITLFSKSKKVLFFIVYIIVEFLVILFCEKYYFINILITLGIVGVSLYHDIKCRSKGAVNSTEKKRDIDRKAMIIACCEDYEEEIKELQVNLNKARKDVKKCKDRASRVKSK